MGTPTDWFWEGNVADGIADHLVSQNWQIVGKANTQTKERGIDIHATRAGEMLLVETKGYPSRSYRDPRRKDETKRTNPSNQAQHWYSHALLKGLRLQTAYPNAKVALGLPNFPRYRTLIDETRPGLERIGLGLLILAEDGCVEEWGI